MKTLLLFLFSVLILKECDSKARIISNEQHIVVNTSFQVKCSATTTIMYCWFTAPNGTAYSLMPNDTTTEHYKYIGRGLESGDCGMEIKSSSISDNGDWKCNMGMSNVIDDRQYIRMNVYDTPLVAERKFISYYDDIISCRTLSTTRLEYCRFIRPDGLGIFPSGNNTEDYSSANTNLTQGICEIRFKNRLSQNVGYWICAAKSNTSDEEYHDSVIVDSYYHIVVYPNVLVILAWIMFILTISLLCILIVTTVYRRRSAATQQRPPRPPPYSPTTDLEIQEKHPLP